MTRRLLAILTALLTLATVLFTGSLSAQTGTVMPTPFQTTWDSNGNPISGGKICTYVAGTTTPVATYTDSGLTVPNGNPITADTAGRFTAYLTPGTSYKFIYQSSDGTAATCNGTVIKTVDNVSAMPASTSNQDIIGTAGEALTAGQPVYLSDGSGAKTAGQWFKADSANTYSSATSTAVGMAPSAINSLATGTVRLGGLVSGLSSLTIGATYYIGSAGALTSTPPANVRIVGVADTTSSLILASGRTTATVGQGGTGVATLTAHGVLIGEATAAVAVSTAGVAGQVLTSGGPSADPSFQNASDGILIGCSPSTTEQVVTNTVTPTSVYSCSVAGGTLSTNKTLELHLTGYYTNTSGGNATFALTGVYGATTFMSGSLTTFATGTTGAFDLVVALNANGTTSSQRAVAKVNMVPSGTATAVGVSTSSGLVNTSWHDAIAEDSTAAKTFSISVTHGTAASTITFKRWVAILKLIG